MNASGSIARRDPESELLVFDFMGNPPGDPYPFYRKLREKAPALITSDGNMMVLSRHADCVAALRNRAFGKGEEWIQARNVGGEEIRPVMERLQKTMILTNPPEHTRLRRVISSAFTLRHVDALRPGIAQRTDALLDKLAAAPGADFMDLVAMPLPVGVIGDLLGIPEHDRARLIPWIHEAGLLIEPASGREEIIRGAKAEKKLAAYVTELIASKRAHPGDDLVSRLTVAEADGMIDETETVATAILLFGGGNKPTSNLLGNGLHALMANPDQFQRIREDRSLIPAAVEEMLRYDSPAHVDALSVLQPATFAGTELRQGQTLIILLGSANRDPDQFPEPDRFDVGRNSGSHLAFASGPHFCLGSPLARVMAEVFLTRALERFTDITPAGTPRRTTGLGHHGFESLPVTASPRETGVKPG